jgi:hypothetical protein
MKRRTKLSSTRPISLAEVRTPRRGGHGDDPLALVRSRTGDDAELQRPRRKLSLVVDSVRDAYDVVIGRRKYRRKHSVSNTVGSQRLPKGVAIVGELQIEYVRHERRAAVAVT